MGKLDKLKRDPFRFFREAKSPAVQRLGRVAVGQLRALSVNPRMRQLSRNPMKFFEEVENPAVRALGLAATRQIPAVIRIVESLADPASTTLGRRAKPGTNQPLVSVVMATHNTELTVACALESVLSQTHRNLEVIVIDDGSTDATGDIVEEIAESDARVLLQRNWRLRGAAEARNQGMSMASGEYLVFHDATEIAAADRIERQVAELVASAHGVVCTVSYRNARGRTTRKAATSMLFARQPVIDEIGYLRASRRGDRGAYCERIRACFGETAERALVSVLYEAQTPPLSFEFADGEKRRLNPAYDERTSWPEPTWQGTAPGGHDEPADRYVPYQPPERRDVKLHKSCRHPDVRPRIQFAPETKPGA